MEESVEQCLGASAGDYSLAAVKLEMKEPRQGSGWVKSIPAGETRSQQPVAAEEACTQLIRVILLITKDFPGWSQDELREAQGPQGSQGRLGILAAKAGARG